jgi:choline-glycine betaine transporter
VRVDVGDAEEARLGDDEERAEFPRTSWFGIFGGTALSIARTSGGISEAVSTDVSTAVYVVLEHLP